MKKIPLTQGMFAIVDDDMFDYLNQWKWYALIRGNRVYARRDIWKNGIRKHSQMHRMVIDVPENMVIDHINHNTLDNRRENLRIATQSQNSMNRSPRKNELNVKGVSRNGSGFKAHVKIEGRCVYSKTFRTLEEAQDAYKREAKNIMENFSLMKRGWHERIFIHTSSPTVRKSLLDGC